MTPRQPPQPVHVPGTSKGEEVVQRNGREPGREECGSRYYRSARDSTSINPRDWDPIDPRSPNLPPA
jgi:hypothetical protein